MPLEIDYGGLMEAMGHYDPLDEILYYLDIETGDVLQIDECTELEARKLDSPDQASDPAVRLAWNVLWCDGESVGPELSEAEEADVAERVDAFLDRYRPVPTADSQESYRDMVDFAATVSDDRLSGMLEVALEGKGAFRRFRDTLGRVPRERDRWREFEDRRLRERVDGWLRGMRLLPGEPAPAPGVPPDVGPPSPPGVTLLNFSHPLTPELLAQIGGLTDQPIGRVVDALARFDHAQPFAAQVAALVDSLGLSPVEWQTLPLLINPPALNVIAVTLLAELHGRMGYFPAVVRLRPVEGSLPPRFEVAEIINLQAVRDSARVQR